MMVEEDTKQLVYKNHAIQGQKQHMIMLIIMEKSGSVLLKDGE